jgi:hypothetical protein
MARISTPDYPIGTPYRPIPDVQDRASRLRWWTFALLAAAGLLLISVAAGVFWANQWSRNTEADNQTSDESPVPVPAAPPSPGQVRAERLLEVLGGLSAAHLGQTFINLGMLEDGVEDETYTKAVAAKNLARMVAWIDQVDGYLAKLGDAGLTRADLDTLARIRRASRSLRAQADALSTYWKDGDKEQRQRCQAARELSWIAIRDLQAKE